MRIAAFLHVHPLESWLAFAIAVSCLTQPVTRAVAQGPGDFENSTDVGRIELPGAVKFDAAKRHYEVTGSGANIWGNVDAFQFVWKKVSGDLEMTTQVLCAGKENRRTARRAAWCGRISRLIRRMPTRSSTATV